MSRNNKYWASRSSEEVVTFAHKKGEDWFGTVVSNGYLDTVKKSWRSYHGCYYGTEHEISFGGEQGELVNIAVNHYRNIARNILNMVTATRPAFQPRSVNTDRRSQIQTKLAAGLLDYYMREKRLERFLKTAVEYAIVLGSGFIKMEWDSTKGRVYDYIEPEEDFIAEYDEDGTPLDDNGNPLESIPVYEGDVVFRNLSPFDAIFDTTKESYEDHEWVIARTFINKYALAAKYPELEEEILKVETKSETARSRFLSNPAFDITEDVPVYEIFHKTNEVLPEGRYLLYLNKDCVLEDTIMPYEELPVYRITSSEMLGSPYGYTDMFDILPLQEAINSLHSTILTNNSTFGVQNVISPTGSNIKLSQLEGGLNHIEYNPMPSIPGGGKPESLQLTQTAPETFNYLQMLVKDIETISGVNSVARGNADSNNLRSGNALALVQSQALQFMSGLQQSYIQLIEDVGTGLIKLLKRFAQTPRIAAISGLSNITEMKEFSAKDLESINRVVVDVGNALSQTSAGRSEIANNLLQMGLITSPEKYLQVLNTGNLDTLTEGEMDELFQIKAENESLIKNEEIIVSALDKHSLHIREHRAVISDPILRRDTDLVARTLQHIQEHIFELKNADPDLLMILGEQPIAPTPQGMPQDEGVDPELMNNPEAQSVAVQDQMGNLPQPAKPPAGFEDAPQTPEQLMMQNLR